MPPKRRIRNGTNHIIKPLISLNNNNSNNIAAAEKNNSSSSGFASITGTSNLNAVNGNGLLHQQQTITKQQQQLNRNNYLSSLTKDQLKFECRKRGQKTSGTKTELVQNFTYNTLFY